MSDWDEIKRLAADFQRTQTSDTLQRISERNVIDIVKMLTDSGMIELIYSCDGKEFITPSHLLREIEDEVFVNGGRMPIHELAAKLNVDFSHVEAKAIELTNSNPDDYNLILGQIIHKTYKIGLGKQIHDIMLTTGLLSLADFAKSLDLPSEFLLKVVKEILPTIMDDFVVSQDGGTYYTSDMMNMYKSVISGTFSAIYRPTSIAALMKRLDIPERIFSPTLDALIKEGRIDGFVDGRTFIPAIHSREQNEWVDGFYASNHYVEYDALTRMQIKQPKAFLKKKFPDGLAMKTCFISPVLRSQVLMMIEDCIASSSWIAVPSIVPSALEVDDIDQLVQDIFKTNKQLATSCLLINQTNVCSLGFIATCKESLQGLMSSKAQEHLKDGKLLSHFMSIKPSKQVPKKEAPPKQASQKDTPLKEIPQEQATPDLKQRDDESDQPTPKASGNKDRKSGGGLTGRETKQKSVKKKYVPGMKGNQKNNEEEVAVTKSSRSNKGRAARRAISPDRSEQKDVPKKEPLIFMTHQELMHNIKTESESQENNEFYQSIADIIHDELNKSYELVAKLTLDEYLKSQSEEDKAEDIDVVE